MADNVTADPGTGGAVFATEEIGGVHFPNTKLTVGAAGVNDGPVSAANPLPGKLYVTDGSDTGTLKAVGYDPATDTPLPVVVFGATDPIDVNISAPVNIGNYPAVQVVEAEAGPLALDASVQDVNAKMPAMVTTVPFNNSAAPPTRIVGQDLWVCSFANVGSSIISSDFTTPILGAGVGYSQAAGALLITTGTTARSEFLTRSTTSWRGSLRLRASIVASQRIAQNNLQIVLADLIGEGLNYNIISAVLVDVALVAHGFTAENVGQFMNLGGVTGAAGVPGRFAIASIPDADTIRFTVAGWPASGAGTVTLFGWNHVKNLVQGTTATQIAFDCQRKGWASGDTTATINTTAGVGTIIQNDFNGRDVFLMDALRATATVPTFTTRASRYENMPDDDAVLYCFIWSYNGTTNPATTTTWTLGFISVEKFANTPVYIQGNRANGAANAMPVTVQSTTGTVTISGTVTANQGTYTAPTASNINSAATTNATSVKASAGTVYGIVASNVNAAVSYVKLYNKASAPTVGTDVPIMVIPIPAGGIVNIQMGPTGHRFTTGIALAITTGMADSDTGAVAVNEIKVATAYI